MAHRGATVTVSRKGKIRNISMPLLAAFERRGWVKTTAKPVQPPVEAKKTGTKPKKETFSTEKNVSDDVDTDK